MDGHDAPSALAWHWVIEALSTFEQISTPTLLGLIDAAPVRLDEFSEKTKELIAMRCFEKLSTVDPDTSSTWDSRVGFNVSRVCEDVLQETLDEPIPLSKLKKAGAELKWDVFSFIKSKRAGTFKCHLEQLRESILEGTHPQTDYLKERSGLFPRNSSYTVVVNDGKPDDHSDKDAGNSTDAENMGEKKNSVSLILENGNKSSKEHLFANNFSPSKRSRVYSDDGHLKRHLYEKQVCKNECDDLSRNSKRLKCYASTCFKSKKKPDSPLRQEVSEHLTEGILLTSEEGEHHAENNSKETLGDGSSEDSQNIPFNDTLMPQYTFGGENSKQLQDESIPHITLPDGIQLTISGSKPWSTHETDLQLEDPNGSPQQIASVKASNHSGNGCGVDISGDIVCQGEKINLVLKKQAEQNLCLKCNDGQLLICDALVQPVVPKNCLGMTTTIMSQHTSIAEPCNYTSMDEIDDTAHHAIPTNVADAEKIQHQPKQKEPDITSLNFSQKRIASDRTEVDMVTGCGAELLNDGDGYRSKNLEAKKHEFLCIPSPVDQDFSAMTKSTEQNLCMKCNEGGQLLACITTTCPLMVHKNCLGASAQLDAVAIFFCPFCAYSHAISEYLEAKKKVCFARKDLAFFISKGVQNQAAELVHEFLRQEHCFSRNSSKSEHVHVEKNKDDQLTGCEDNTVDHVGEHANEANNLQFERSQQQAPISRRENINNGSVEVLREEEIGEIPNANSLTGGRVEENEVPTDHVDGHVGHKSTCEETNISPVNQNNVGEEVPQEMTRQNNTDKTIESVSAHDTWKEKISENECEKHSTLRYSMRLRKHETQYKPQASPELLCNQLRRKKVPWTAEEEELIREGAQKFGFDDRKKWKKILAFGSHVFEKVGKRRTPQDLKDKWKTMCKAHSKSK